MMGCFDALINPVLVSMLSIKRFACQPLEQSALQMSMLDVLFFFEYFSFVWTDELDYFQDFPTISPCSEATRAIILLPVVLHMYKEVGKFILDCVEWIIFICWAYLDSLGLLSSGIEVNVDTVLVKHAEGFLLDQTHV